MGLFVFLMVSLVQTEAYSQSAVMSKKALIMLRLMAYDRNLPKRSKSDRVDVLVVYPAGGKDDGASKALQKAASRFKLSGRTVHVHTMAFKEHDGYSKKITSLKPAAQLLTKGFSAEVSEKLLKQASARDILTFTHDQDQISRGAAIGVLGEKKLKLIINLPALRAQGADMPGSVLNIADEIHR